MMPEREVSPFGTPAAELLDHRPGSGVGAGPSRRSKPSTEHTTRPGFADLTPYFSGDTCAIDDSNSIYHHPPEHVGRRQSHTPRARRNTFARNDHDNRSRRSSTSSSQSWQPTSVDAFASRRRAGTIDSTPDLENVLQRTLSVAQRTRRPTESEAVDVRDTVPVAATPSTDVFCPPIPAVRTCKIDYEDLEEFLDELRSDIPVRCVSTHSTHASRRHSRGTHVPSTSSKDPASNDEFKEKDQTNDDSDSDVDGPSPAQLVAVPSTPETTLPRYTFFSSELEDTIFASSFLGLLADDEKISYLFEPAIESGGVWWLDMLNPSKEAVVAICKGFNVHPLTREDILTQETREKVELFKSYYFVCFRSFYSLDKQSENYMEPVNVYAVVFREGLLTFSFCNNPHAQNVRSRIGKLRDYLQLSADWICYALIDDIVDTFGPVIRDIELESDSIEDEVLIARADDSLKMLQRISVCRKKVMQLLRLLGGKADVIKGFAKRCNERYEVAPRGDVGLYLSDIQDHVITMMANLAHFEKMLGRSHSNYLAQLSIDNLQQGNKVNETLGKVTLIATILVPLNLVTGLFGMNVHVPGADNGTGGYQWFFGIVGFIALVVLLALCWAKKAKFI